TGAGLVADDSNLVIRAWRLLEEAAKRPLPAALRLEKRIPHGAGLGGGSSDAAAALRLGNRMFELGLPDSELLRMAARLGSDVPLFLLGGTVLGIGRGERVFPLRPVPLEPILLVHPGLHVGTPGVYRALQDVGYPFPEALASQPGGAAPPGATTSPARPCGSARPWRRCAMPCATPAATPCSAAPAAAGRRATPRPRIGRPPQPSSGPPIPAGGSGRREPLSTGDRTVSAFAPAAIRAAWAPGARSGGGREALNQ
ncbi:MAG TPA: hypothetical protein VFV26_07785, partial [Geothrix sp.]|nr:hypothetical protein [Geothrix sp.]